MLGLLAVKRKAGPARVDGGASVHALAHGCRHGPLIIENARGIVFGLLAVMRKDRLGSGSLASERPCCCFLDLWLALGFE